MKLSHILVAAALLLAACQNQSGDSTKGIPDTATSPAVTHADRPSHEPAGTMSADLASFPHEWVGLTKRDGAYIIFTPCDADNSSIHIVKADGHDALQYVWGQEVSTYPITAFQRPGAGTTEITALTESEPQSPFTYTVEVVDSVRHISLWKWEWSADGEKQKYEEYFTPVSNAASFTAVTQPCTDCWSEEECREMEKNHD
jgi:hypothetical protein